MRLCLLRPTVYGSDRTGASFRRSAHGVRDRQHRLGRRGYRLRSARVFLKNLLMRHARCKPAEHVAYRDSHPSDARTPAPLARRNRDDLLIAHSAHDHAARSGVMTFAAMPLTMMAAAVAVAAADIPEADNATRGAISVTGINGQPDGDCPVNRRDRA